VFVLEVLERRLRFDACLVWKLAPLAEERSGFFKENLSLRLTCSSTHYSMQTRTRPTVGQERVNLLSCSPHKHTRIVRLLIHHSRFIPEGVADTSQTHFTETPTFYQNDLAMRNTA
jgi:hypothetical protein